MGGMKIYTIFLKSHNFNWNPSQKETLKISNLYLFKLLAIYPIVKFASGISLYPGKTVRKQVEVKENFFSWPQQIYLSTYMLKN